MEPHVLWGRRCRLASDDGSRRSHGEAAGMAADTTMAWMLGHRALPRAVVGPCPHCPVPCRPSAGLGRDRSLPIARAHCVATRSQRSHPGYGNICVPSGGVRFRLVVPELPGCHAAGAPPSGRHYPTHNIPSAPAAPADTSPTRTNKTRSSPPPSAAASPCIACMHSTPRTHPPAWFPAARTRNAGRSARIRERSSSEHGDTHQRPMPDPATARRYSH